MQKTFIKYTLAVMTAGILLILGIDFLFTLRSLESAQYNTFHTKIKQVVHTLENNQMELSLMNANLDRDYLTRAKAAEYVLDRQRNISMDVSEMQYLAKLLDVDELHIIDEKGIIVSGSVSKYIGMDMKDDKQTREFLSLLENEDENAYLIQEAQPNAAEKKMMQYVGVARKGQKGIVQVGFAPTRQMEAESRNSYKYIFSKFPTDVGEELYAIDVTEGKMVGHSGGMNLKYKGECYQIKHLLECTEGAYKKGQDGERMYVVSRLYDDVLICAAVPGTSLFEKTKNDFLDTLLYLLIVEAGVIVLLNFLVKKKVIDGIHHIIDALSMITRGNLEITVSETANQEFVELSNGINAMVESIISISDRISAIIEISGIPLAAFEYEMGTEHVFITSRLRELLQISDREAERLCGDSAEFDHYIRKIIEHPIEEEEDVYEINDQKYVRIYMSESEDGYLGVITDVTGAIMEKRKMRYENTHDPLTGLYKFPHFKQRAEEVLRGMPSGKIGAMVMLDLDYFKSINDTYGHDMGDVYLQKFACGLRSLSRDHVIPARRSGDEFCIMIYDCESKEEIIQYLNELYAFLENHPVKLSDADQKVIGASAGFALAEGGNGDVSTLLSCADEALYDMKRGVKGHYVEYKKGLGDLSQREINDGEQ